MTLKLDMETIEELQGGLTWDDQMDAVHSSIVVNRASSNAREREHTLTNPARKALSIARLREADTAAKATERSRRRRERNPDAEREAARVRKAQERARKREAQNGERKLAAGE